MQGITLLIGLISSALVLVLQPVYALVVYITTLIWYPYYLTFQAGTMDFSAGRIVTAVIFLRCMLDDKLRRKFVWSLMDTLVLSFIAIYVGVYCIAYKPFFAAIENRCGFVLDTWCVYLIARFIITDKDVLIRFIKIISLVLAPLAISGIIEASTGWQPFLQLERYRLWRPKEVEAGDMLATDARWGFTRAVGPFSHSIMFGNCFIIFLPLIWVLRHQHGYWGKLAYLFSGMVILGAFSSMSSGPWGMLVIVILCLILERYKHLLKPILLTLVILCVSAGVVGNRPIHHIVLSNMNLGQGDWYSRAKLIDAAIDHFGRWWLAGYGGNDPGWGSKDGGYFYGSFTDANNEFILVGIEAGIFAVIALFAVLITAFRLLSQASQRTTNLELKSLYWSLGSLLVGVISAWQAVSYFGQMVTLFYAILGILGASLAFSKKLEFSNQLLIPGGAGYQYSARTKIMPPFDRIRK